MQEAAICTFSFCKKLSRWRYAVHHRSLDFARHAEAHHGKIVLSEFERLQDDLTSEGGELQYAITGALDINARPLLKILFRGK